MKRVFLVKYFIVCVLFIIVLNLEEKPITSISYGVLIMGSCSFNISLSAKSGLCWAFHTQALSF
ncbi:hypothetical protein HanRHA438_Chr16g0783961 [Helianthus annuus]|nr:hypothetical protein HanRHA438_Chr16g0783961 [Helianthus annuus]